jgi:hypothetical protein
VAILNKQSWIAENGWFCSLGVRHGGQVTIPDRKSSDLCATLHRASHVDRSSGTTQANKLNTIFSCMGVKLGLH